MNYTWASAGLRSEVSDAFLNLNTCDLGLNFSLLHLSRCIILGSLFFFFIPDNFK